MSDSLYRAGNLRNLFSYNDDPLVKCSGGREPPYLCDYHHPISLKRLETIPENKVATIIDQAISCLNSKGCFNAYCLRKGRANEIRGRDMQKTIDKLSELRNRRRSRVTTQHSKPRVIKDKVEKHVHLPDPKPVSKKKIVERHLKPDVIKDKVEKHVYLPDPKPAPRKKKIIARHMEPEIIKDKVEKHVYLPDPKPVVQKKKVIHLEPEIITHHEEKHVYVPDPVVETEHKIIYHHQGGSSQFRSGYGYGESSTMKTSYKRNEARGLESDYSRSYSPSPRGRDRRSDYHGKGKGKQKENRRESRSISRRRDRDRDRSPSSSRSRRYNRSRSSSRSRRRDRTHSRSPTRRPEKSRSPSPSPSRSRSRTSSHHSSAHGPREETRPPTPPAFDPYAALGLQDKREAADAIDIETTYKFLVRKWHPDKHVSKGQEEQDKATARTAELNRAYDVLGDVWRRRIHDRTGKTEIWEIDELVEKEKEKQKGGRELVRRGGKGG